jgi:hypothetical protein
VKQGSSNVLVNDQHLVVSRSVMDVAVEACGGNIKDKRGQYVFSVVSRSIHGGEKGYPLRAEDFPTQRLAKDVQVALRDGGVVTCPDWDSWKMTNSKKANSKCRRFHAADNILEMNLTSSPWVHGYTEYARGGGTMHPKLAKSEVALSKDARISVPTNVVSNLGRGTGLEVDYTRAMEIINGSTRKDRTKLLRALAGATRSHHGELNSHWNQSPCARIYSGQPNLQGIPSVLRPALRSIDGLSLFEVDYAQCELRLAYAEIGVQLPFNVNQHEAIAHELGIPVKWAKAIINPFFNGQRYNQILMCKELKHLSWETRMEMATHAKKLDPYFKQEGIMPVINDLRSKDEFTKNRLKRVGAQIFFNALSVVYEKLGIKAGLPLHDGLIFACNPSDAAFVQDAFQYAAKNMYGFELPARLEKVA